MLENPPVYVSSWKSKTQVRKEEQKKVWNTWDTISTKAKNNCCKTADVAESWFKHVTFASVEELLIT